MTRTFRNPIKAAALAALLATPVAATVSRAQGVSIGDLDGYDDYYADQSGEAPVVLAEPAAQKAPAAAPAAVAAVAAATNEAYEASVEPVTYVGDQSYETSGPIIIDDCNACGSTTGCGCNAAPITHHRMARACRPVDRMNGWLTAEALLWFPQDRRLPPLVNTAAPGVEPIQGVGRTVFGGDANPIDDGLSGGFRIDAGVYLSDSIGVGGRYWSIDDAQTSGTFGDDLGQGDSIGRPFFDPGLPGDNVGLISFNDGNGNAQFAGTVTASTDLDIYGAEAYARIKLISGRCFRSELIGGYSHFGIQDSLSVVSATEVFDLSVGTVGDTVTISDFIDADNEFHGGQIGFNTRLTRGRWAFLSLTKVHLGNMEQTFRATGSRIRTAVDGRVESTDQTDQNGANGAGILSLGVQDVDRDVYTFAPEANVKLAYRFRPNVSLSVGYSFIYWDRVLLVEDNLTTAFNNDSTQLLIAPTEDLVTPTVIPQDRGFWVQGVDLGAVIEF